MKKSILTVTFILAGFIVGINAQEYWIEGFYERHGEGQYTLKDVHTNGIRLDGKTSLSETLRGDKKRITCDGVEATMVKFSFEKATTDCPTKWDKGFVFQYWDEDNNKWKTDVEACKGQTTSYSEKNMVMMLVLDYSFSMKDNISRIQASAIKFINSVSRVSEGNVHIGIIAFSGMDLAKNQVFPITPLTNENKYRFETFIRDSQKGKETALYYSMDTAIQMLENYVSSKGITRNKYNGACMITFTDGLDNASINDKISNNFHRGRKNEYLAYISKQLRGAERKYILGMPLENFAIGFSGSENFESEDLAFFREVLMQTTPDENHFKLASRFEEVEEYFEYITKNLTERWENLNMYVGESQHGRIRWVLNCGEPPRVETPKPIVVRTKPSPWFGISLELGGYGGFFGGLNLDMAFSLNKTLAIGGRIGLFYSSYIYTEEVSYQEPYFESYWNGYYWQEYVAGYNTYYNYYDYEESTIGFLIGPEVKLTFPKNNAVIVGLGGGFMANEDAFYLRLGYKTKKSFFVTADMLFGGYFGAGIGAGFSFGGKQRNK